MLVKKHFWHKTIRAVSLLAVLFISTKMEAQQQRASFLFGQACDTVLPSVPKWHKWMMLGEGAFMAGTLTSLGVIWYGQEDGFGKFKTFNDITEWQQVDKVGHLVTSFHFMQGNSTALQFFGVDKCRSTKFSFWNALTFMTTIEVLDGLSPDYGFSFSDLGANAIGVFGGLYAAQLPEDRMWFNLKYSFQPTDFAMENPNLLGENLSEQWLKDYNGQTYWLSLVPGNMGKNKVPKWLGVAVGYGANGMVNAIEQKQYDRGYAYGHSREYYLGLDVHLEYLFPMHSKAYKIFKLLSFMKLPLPGMKVAQNGVTFHGFLVN